MNQLHQFLLFSADWLNLLVLGSFLNVFFSLNSNLTKNLNELKESCRQQSEELQDLLIQRDKLKEESESVVDRDHDDTLVNDSGLEKPTAATPTKIRDARKKAKKEEADLGFEDEALQVEDLEPPGVTGTKVCIIPRGIRPQDRA